MSDLQTTRFTPPESRSFRLEWFLSVIAALNCIIVVAVIVINSNPEGNFDLATQWPFPLLYFIEIVSIGILSLVAVGSLQWLEKPNWSAVFWVCSGLLLSFVILGAWTIGFFLVPAMVIFILLGIMSDKRTGNDIPLHIVFFVAAAVVQAIIVFLTLIG